MKFLLLDFDGTLIEDNQGFPYDVTSLALLPGVVGGLQRLRDAGMRFFIVTNQSKIGRGTAPESNVIAAIERVIELLAREGVRIDAYQWCPHRPEEGCACRKPSTGMWDTLRLRYPELEARETTMVGDSGKDMLLGQAIGCRTAALFPTRYPHTVPATFVVRSLSELADVLLAPAERVHPLKEVKKLSRGARAQGQTVVTTNGAFDLFHDGHRFLLEEARKQGDFLVVGVNGDASVRRAKGDGRPVQNAETRARNVARFADAVFVFDDDDPRPWLPLISPSVHVNAATYGEQCVERPVLDELGARLVLVPVRRELGSTTQYLSHLPPVL